jgi:chromosome partitioning protein
MKIAVASLKGGSGKTTLAVNIAAALNAVLLDCDLQQNAVEWNAIKAVSLPLDEQMDVKQWSSKVESIRSRYVVIDTPPNFNQTTQAALLTSDIVLIPCCASGNDIRSAAKTIGLIRTVQAKRNGKPHIMVIPSKVDRRTSAGRALAEDLKGFGVEVGPSIGLRTAFADCINFESWIGAYAPESLGHNEILELVKRIKKHEKK